MLNGGILMQNLLIFLDFGFIDMPGMYQKTQMSTRV